MTFSQMYEEITMQMEREAYGLKGDLQMQCDTDCCKTEGPSCPTPTGAMEYAFDASMRVFERQQEVIENEIIKARETGQREGREQQQRANAAYTDHLLKTVQRLQASLDEQRAILTRPLVIQTASSVELQRLREENAAVHKRNQNQYDMITELEKQVADLQERNAWQADRLVEGSKANERLQKELREEEDAYDKIEDELEMTKIELEIEEGISDHLQDMVEKLNRKLDTAAFSLLFR